MPLIYLIAGFVGGYVYASTRRTWQDWSRASAAAEMLRAKRWNDLRSTLVVGLIIFGLLYMYLRGKA